MATPENEVSKQHGEGGPKDGASGDTQTLIGAELDRREMSGIRGGEIAGAWC
jgi:hypothetical protein